MEELKTLKDLKGWDEHIGAVSRLELKYELGIKWIKYYQDILKNPNLTNEDFDEANTTIKILSIIFNIISEDLK